MQAQTHYRYRFGTADFDESRVELQVGGLPVEVEPKPLAVLACLLRRAGEVVTRDELIEEVWDGRLTVEQVLTNAISKLRKALGEANAALLVNQARVGYRLTGHVERVAVGRRLSSQLDLAAGAPVPTRENYVLQQLLGHTHGSEVWLAHQLRTREPRVFKFAADGSRLGALKREATLSRLLRESLGERSDFAKVIDWNFAQPPFFLECEYGGQNLLEWSKDGNPLATWSEDQRLALVLQIADAVVAAHSVGVLHKDLKPANVLVSPTADGLAVQLTDFGSSRLLEPERLQDLGITQLGLTLTQNIGGDSSAGTPLYIAPELIAGRTPTVQSDLFALGVILYQTLAGDYSKPIVPGWEQEIADELLREDIALATDGDPARRLGSVAELVVRLRTRDTRRAERQRAQDAQAQALQAQRVLERAKARRPYLVATILALCGGLLGSTAFGLIAMKERNRAQQQASRAANINAFFANDLLGAANPYVAGQKDNPHIRDVLQLAASKVDLRLQGDPIGRAAVWTTLAESSRGLSDDLQAEAAGRNAMSALLEVLAADDPQVVEARDNLAVYLTIAGKTQEAKALLDENDALYAALDGLSRHAVVRHHMARGMVHQQLLQPELSMPHLQAVQQLVDPMDAEGYGSYEEAQYLLAENLAKLQRYDEALALLDPMLQGHPPWDRLSVLRRILALKLRGQISAFRADYQVAHEMLEEAHRTAVVVYGEENPRTLIMLYELGSVQSAMGQYADALNSWLKAHRGFSNTVGPDSPKTLVAALAVGQAQASLGRPQEAEKTLDPAFEGLKSRYGLTSPYTQMALFWRTAVQAENMSVPLASIRSSIASMQVDELHKAAPSEPWEALIAVIEALLLFREGHTEQANALIARIMEQMRTEQRPDDQIRRISTSFDSARTRMMEPG